MEIQAIERQLSGLVAKDRLQAAIEQLKNIFEATGEAHSVEELILLSGRLELVERNNRLGILSFNDYESKRAEIRDAVSDYIPTISEYITKDNEKAVEKTIAKRSEIKLSAGFFYAFILLSLACLSYVVFQSFYVPNNHIDAREELLENPGLIDIWNSFENHINYYNAPFTHTDPDHINFKRDFLKNNRGNNPVFKILFFRGHSEEEKKEYVTKFHSFLGSLKDIYEEDRKMRDLLITQIEVKLDTISRIPHSAFFLTEIKKVGPAALIYMYKDKLIERTPSGTVGEIAFGVLVKKNSSSKLKFHYKDFNGTFREAWDSPENVRINLDSLLKTNK